MLLSKYFRYDWRLPVYLSAILVAILFVISDDLIQTLIFFLLTPTLVLAEVILVLLAALRRRRNFLWVAGAIGVFFLCSTALIAYQRDDPQCIRSMLRWTLLSPNYKSEVLAQKQPLDGTSKHIEWDGWGGTPVGDWTMYLVYNPSDSLRSSLKERKSRMVPGVPCPVDRVHQLAAHWYTVLYPMSCWWDDCKAPPLRSSRSRS